MTHNPLTLEQYFHVINQPKKETTMFEYLKTYFKNVKEAWNSLYSWDNAVQRTKAYEALHTEIEQAKADLETLPMEDYWAFEIHTGEWVDEFGEVRPVEHDIIIKDNDSTWHELLDQILDVMEKHYGYNIKEQVYYSVSYPLNKEGMSGYGRMLNDEVLQKLLLAYPEVYETRVKDFEWKPL